MSIGRLTKSQTSDTVQLSGTQRLENKEPLKADYGLSKMKLFIDPLAMASQYLNGRQRFSFSYYYYYLNCVACALCMIRNFVSFFFFFWLGRDQTDHKQILTALIKDLIKSKVYNLSEIQCQDPSSDYPTWSCQTSV